MFHRRMRHPTTLNTPEYLLFEAASLIFSGLNSQVYLYFSQGAKQGGVSMLRTAERPPPVPHTLIDLDHQSNVPKQAHVFGCSKVLKHEAYHNNNNNNNMDVYEYLACVYHIIYDSIYVYDEVCVWSILMSFYWNLETDSKLCDPVQIGQLHLYDCLRANKAMMAWGVEALRWCFMRFSW